MGIVVPFVRPDRQTQRTQQAKTAALARAVCKYMRLAPERTELAIETNQMPATNNLTFTTEWITEHVAVEITANDPTFVSMIARFFDRELRAGRVG